MKMNAHLAYRRMENHEDMGSEQNPRTTYESTRLKMTRRRGQEGRRVTHSIFLDNMPEMMERPVGDASLQLLLSRVEDRALLTEQMNQRAEDLLPDAREVARRLNLLSRLQPRHEHGCRHRDKGGVTVLPCGSSSRVMR